jgi:hypothetical protein
MAEARLPGNVRRVDIPGGVRYILPRRPSIGGMLYIPLFLGMAFTLAGSGVALMTDVFHTHSDIWIGRAFGYGFGGVGLLMLTLGTFLSFGHVEIELASGRLRIVSRAGLLRRSRSCPAQGLRIVTAINTPGEENGRPMTGDGGEIAMLRGTWEGGGTRTLASAYPMAWLTGIAQDLTERLGPSAVMEQVRPGSYRSTASTSAQPAGSNAVLRPSPDGLTLVLPPLGIGKGSSGYLSFGLLWIAMILGMNVACYFFMTRSSFLAWTYVFVTVFMVLLSGVGWAMLAAAIHLGRRKAVFEAAGGRLTLTTDGPFGKKRYDWALADLVTIDCGPSGRTTNGIPHMALLIRSRGNDPVKSLEERDPVELRWVAQVLTAEVARARSK